MFLRQLSLHFFRNHTGRSWTFSQPTTVIVGENAHGKTSILEAIYLLASGGSFRAETVPEMIQFNQELSRIKGVVEDGEKQESSEELQESESTIVGDATTTEVDTTKETTTLEIILTRGEVQGKKTALRLYSVNDVRRRKKDYLGYIRSVVFRPEDMRLVEGSPSRRRSFLDGPLCLIDPEYDRSLATYEQTLQRRNKLLLQIKDGQQHSNVLTYWNMSLAKHGEYITRMRQQFLEFFRAVDFPLGFSVRYEPSPISIERIQEYQDREILVGHTLIGPHKDDFSVLLGIDELNKTTLLDTSKSSSTSTASEERVEIASYGSRGQQRLAVLWLKIGEFMFLKQKTNQYPLLLLDDILSELDYHSRHKVLTLVGRGQCIITTTEPKIVTEINETVNQLEIIEL